MNRVKCEACGSSFSRKGSLALHMKTIHSESPTLYKCAVCPKEFKRKGNLKVHHIVHSEDRPHGCNQCSRKFRYKMDLSNHLLCVHSSDTSLNCGICHKRYNSKGHLKQHWRTHMLERPYNCEHCGKRFARVDYLKTHSKYVHSTDYRLFPCDSCGREYKHKHNLKSHLVKEHNQSDLEIIHICEVCQRQFRTLGDLNGHKTNHTRPRKCSFCPKGFNCKSRLEAHISANHTKERPRKCYFCQDWFRQKDHFFSHLRRHTMERPYGCSDCGQSFECAWNLQRHSKQHR